MGTIAADLRKRASDYNTKKAAEEAVRVGEFRLKFVTPLVAEIIQSANARADSGKYDLSWQSHIDDAMKVPFNELLVQLKSVLEVQYGFRLENPRMEDTADGGYTIEIEISW